MTPRPKTTPPLPITAAAGSRPRVLHVGNIGNNAYQNARILNRAGIESDVLCYDYYHVMGCPEWEDADVDRLPAGFDHDFPSWSGVPIRDFHRPAWFAQGPLPLAALYLHCRRRRLPVAQAAVGRALDASRWLVTWPCVRRAGQLLSYLFRGVRRKLRERAVPGLSSEAGGPSGPADPLIQRFAALFPDRPDQLRQEDLVVFAAVARPLKRLFARYDVIVGYSTDVILPMLAGHPRYVAFEHGTLRSIPFEDSPVGRLTALAYRTAACAFVTNCDNIRAVERLGLDNARYVPHPMNDALLAAADGTALRQQLLEDHGADFIVFHPSRHHWQAERHPSWEKGNDVLLRGFGRFVRDVAPRALLVLVRWGKTVAESEALLRSEGVDQRVVWIDPVPNRVMLRYIRASDVIADQFWLGTFGGITPKAMACGRPVLLHLDPDVHRWCFPEMPPVLESRSPEDVLLALSRCYRDPAFRHERGVASREWYARYHSEAVIRDTLVNGLAAALSVTST